MRWERGSVVQTEWSGIQGPAFAPCVPLPCLGELGAHPAGMQLQGPPSYWAAALSRWVLISCFWRCHYSLSKSCSHAPGFLHCVLIRNRSHWRCHRTTTYSPQEAWEPGKSSAWTDYNQQRGEGGGECNKTEASRKHGGWISKQSHFPQMPKINIFTRDVLFTKWLFAFWLFHIYKTVKNYTICWNLSELGFALQQYSKSCPQNSS